MSISKQLSCMGAFALCVSFIAVGHADTSAQTEGRRQIAAAYANSARALMRRDLKGAFAMEAPDYQNYTVGGVAVSREQEMAQMQRAFTLVRSVPKAEVKIMSLKWRGPDAVVMAQYTLVLMVAKGSKTVRSEVVSISRDYWSHNPAGWQVRQAVGRSGKVWINGKRFG